MRLFQDLSDEDKRYHLKISNGLEEGGVYSFDPPIQVVPLYHQIRGADGEGISIAVSSAQFIRRRAGKGNFQDCLFSVQTRLAEQAGLFEYVVPVLFIRGMPAPSLI